MKFGKIEQKLYELRSESPLVIPQFDPNSISLDYANEAFSKLDELGINHIAIGGTIIDVESYDALVSLATNDYDFSTVLYPTNSGFTTIKDHDNKVAVYWMSVWNAENTFFLRDVLTMNAISTLDHNLEPLPTVYVFDDRGDNKASNWLTRSTPIPRDKPYISLSIALAAQFCGYRFYIMAGGSGCKLMPPEDHVKLLSERTDLFIIPTSGITSVSHAKTLFSAGADAIHLGNLLEQKDGLDILEKIVIESKNYSGKQIY